MSSAWLAATHSAAKDSTQFHDYFALISPVALYHHFKGVRIIEGPHSPIRPALLRYARGGPVLFVLCAILLMAATAGCSGNLGGNIRGWSPATANDGLVYVATRQGEIKVLEDNGFDGASFLSSIPLPTRDDDRGAYYSPVVAGDLVYVTSADGHLFALEREGLGLVENNQWPISVGQRQSEEFHRVIAGPVLWDAPGQQRDLVLVGSEDGNLYAYNAGARRPEDEAENPLAWHFTTGGEIWSTPVIREGTAYFGSHDHNVYAVYLDEGRDTREKWKFATGGTVASRPLVFRDMVIVGSFDKKLYALDAGDGTLRWTFEGNNWFWAGAVADEETIFAPSMDGNVYALDAGGNLRWKHQMGSAIVSTPALTTGGLVVAGKDGKVSLLDIDPAPLGQSQQVDFFFLSDTEVKAPLSMWVTPKPTTDEQYNLLLQMIGGVQLAQDPRFATATARQNNRQELEEEIDRWMSTQDRETIGRRLFGAGIPLEESVFLGAQDSTVWRFNVKGDQLTKVWCFHAKDDVQCD